MTLATPDPGSTAPLVTVGMATYNAQAYVDSSIRSLLSLDYPNLRFIINDNGSTDRTFQIIEDHVRRDERVSLGRWPENRGAAANFNHLAAEARGSYFFWASDHDSWHPSFVDELVSVMEADEGVVLAYPQTTLVDFDGHERGVMDDFVDVSSPDKVARYRRLVWQLTFCNMVYGMMRRTALQSTWGTRPVIGSDHLLLAQLALRGRFVRVDRPLFFRRENRVDGPWEPDAVIRQLARVTGNLSSASTGPSALFRRLRDEHLDLVRTELSGTARIRADISTRSAFASRYGVHDPLASMLSSGSKLRSKVRQTRRHWRQA